MISDPHQPSCPHCITGFLVVDDFADYLPGSRFQAVKCVNCARVFEPLLLLNQFESLVAG